MSYLKALLYPLSIFLKVFAIGIVLLTLIALLNRAFINKLLIPQVNYEDFTIDDMPSNTGVVTAEADSMEAGEQDIDNQVVSDNKPKILKKYRDLYAQNSDMIGYIYLNEDYEYPILQRVMNQNYYIDHNFNGQESVSGSIFANRYTKLGESGIALLYGHRLKSGEMFSSLKYYIESNKYMEENSEIRIDTLYEKGKYELAGLVLISLDNEFAYYDFVGDVTESEFDKWKAGMQEHCIKGSMDSLSYGDTIVELSTCEYSSENGREVVVFKKV